MPRWLLPPQTDDAYERVVYQSLHYILLLFLFFSLGSSLQPITIVYWPKALALTLFSVFLISYMLLQQHRLQFAGALFLGTFWLIITVVVFVLNGIHNVAIYLHIVPILLSSMLFKRLRVMLTITLLSLLNIIVLAVGDLRGVLPLHSMPPTLLNHTITPILVLGSAGLFSVFSSRALRNSIAQLRQNQETLQIQNRELETLTYDLTESETQYRQLINNSVQGIAILQDGRIVFANPAISHILGRDVSELLAMSAEEVISLVHPEERVQAAANLQNRQAGRYVEPHYQQRLIRADGQIRTVELHASQIVYQGSPAVQATYIDLTERRQAEDAEHEQRILAEALHDIAAALSRTLDLEEVLDYILMNVGRVVPHDAANIMLIEDGVAYVVRAHGYAQHISERSLGELRFVVADMPDWMQMIQAEQPFTIPDTQAHAPWTSTLIPEAAWIRSTVKAPIHIEGQIVGIIHLDSATPNTFTFSDAEKLQAFAHQAAIAIQNARLFQKLESYNEDLEQAVIERTTELTRANAELKRLGRVKDEFVSNVSHELRTPITVLTMYHYLLRKKPENIGSHLGVLERETARLNHTIEDLLRLSRLDQGRTEVNLKPIDLNPIAENLVNDRVLQAQQKGLALEFLGQSNLPIVMGDQGLIEQVMSILLTNAINYTPLDGRIVVSTQTTKTDTGQWAGFSVRDTGLGISPEEQAHLFERFFQGAASKQSGVPGTGLGLAIAREIVDRHHGRIEVESTGIPGKGTKFSVWLSVAEGSHV